MLPLKKYVSQDKSDTNVLNYKDQYDLYIFREFINSAKNGAGSFEYFWPKPNTSNDYLKLFKRIALCSFLEVYRDTDNVRFRLRTSGLSSSEFGPL